MTAGPDENLRCIRFEGELLPNWAQLLDLAAGICGVPEETRRWFSRFTSCNGVDDSRSILAHCEVLRSELQHGKGSVLAQLERGPEERRPAEIYAAWMYALDTIIQQAASSRTCSWLVAGKSSDDDDFGGGEIELRRPAQG